MQGRLLISDPFMQDSYFKRTVVLLCTHDQKGTYGFIINKFIDISLHDIFIDMPAYNRRIGLGGPVQTTNLYYIHTKGKIVNECVEIYEGLYAGGDFEQIKSYMQTGIMTENDIRFFVGYSGWEQNQLDDEIHQKSWYVCLADDLPIMSTNADDIWSLALKQMGGEFANLANFPEDPGLN